MTKLAVTVFLTFLFFSSRAQNVAQITIDNRGNNDIITFLVDNSIALNISKDGKIIEWGMEYTSPYTGVYPKMEKYMGREEYYPETENDAVKGKLKYLGSTLITYYTSDDNVDLQGKVKSIGNNFIDYYTNYENVAFRGFIRNAGPLTFTYYSDYDDQYYKGKIKSVGSTLLAYYGSFDDKAFRGKVKNVDRNVFTYYSSYDLPEYNGMMKTGTPMVTSGSIKYIIKNY